MGCPTKERKDELMYNMCKSSLLSLCATENLWPLKLFLRFYRNPIQKKKISGEGGGDSVAAELVVLRWDTFGHLGSQKN